MSSLRPSLRPLARNRIHRRTQWHDVQQQLQKLSLGAGQTTRNASTDADIKVDKADLVIKPIATYARAVPASPAYFSRQANFIDSYVKLESLYRKYGRLPTAPPDTIQAVSWKNARDYKDETGETVKASLYNKAIKIVKAMHKIHPQLRPEPVEKAVARFMKNTSVNANHAKPIPIDKFGRALGVGRRKTSTARAWVVQGTGEVLINGKPLNDAFGRIHDRESATWALRSTERFDKYNVWALVEGGGTTGQAEALTLAVAKALVAHEPALKTVLRRPGCMTRDARMVERKKPGHVNARKMPAWVKR